MIESFARNFTCHQVLATYITRNSCLMPALSGSPYLGTTHIPALSCTLSIKPVLT